MRGNISRYDDRRYTPYQLAHSTQIKGISTITNGDHRFYNNIFVGGEDKKTVYGLAVYNPAKRPVYATGNLFYNGAKPMGKKEQGVTDENFNPQLTLEEKEDGVYLSFAVDREHLSDLILYPVTFEMLGQAQLTGYSYTMPDGTPIKIDKDYWGNQRLDDSLIVGPFQIIPKEKHEVKVWDTSH